MATSEEGATARAPGYELEPEQIALLLTEDLETWVGLALALEQSGQVFLNAIEGRDAASLFDAIGVR